MSQESRLEIEHERTLLVYACHEGKSSPCIETEKRDAVRKVEMLSIETRDVPYTPPSFSFATQPLMPGSGSED